MGYIPTGFAALSMCPVIKSCSFLSKPFLHHRVFLTQQHQCLVYQFASKLENTATGPHYEHTHTSMNTLNVHCH